MNELNHDTQDLLLRLGDLYNSGELKEKLEIELAS